MMRQALMLIKLLRLSADKTHLVCKGDYYCTAGLPFDWFWLTSLSYVQNYKHIYLKENTESKLQRPNVVSF